MSLTSELKDYLATVDDGTIRRGVMPATPDEVLVIGEFGGGPAMTGFSIDGVQHEEPGVQIRVRGKAHDYDTPRARIETAYQELCKVQGQTLGSTFYLFCRALQAPFFLRTDEKERYEFVVNFLCEKEPSA